MKKLILIILALIQVQFTFGQDFINNEKKFIDLQINEFWI